MATNKRDKIVPLTSIDKVPPNQAPVQTPNINEMIKQFSPAAHLRPKPSEISTGSFNTITESKKTLP
eukprot:15216290-Ditylum_brightwellii.AAC.1